MWYCTVPICKLDCDTVEYYMILDNKNVFFFVPVWLDTRTKSTVDKFTTKSSKKVLEHVRVRVMSLYFSTRIYIEGGINTVSVGLVAFSAGSLWQI